MGQIDSTAGSWPVRIIASYPSWDRFVFMVHPRAGIRSLKDIKAKQYPLRVSVREDPTHSTLVLIEQAFALHGFKLEDIEAWGGRIITCGGPSDVRRLDPLARGEIDAVFDEGIRVWLNEALAAKSAGAAWRKSLRVDMASSFYRRAQFRAGARADTYARDAA